MTVSVSEALTGVNGELSGARHVTRAVSLATASEANRPHVIGVIYVAVGSQLYIHSLDGSRKVRNIRANPKVGVCVPTRTYPFAPPFCS